MELIGVGVDAGHAPNRLGGVELSPDVAHDLASIIDLEVGLLASAWASPAHQGTIAAVMIHLQDFAAPFIIHPNAQVTARIWFHRTGDEFVRESIVDMHPGSCEA
eukprot:CAMPEP_0114686774 /NCGR_PEP_ID=MMETSP0191-20121206/61837_1 /TAXON_ID=126664 /ORGANISM="Sorites sp." /LENGTH=104 /DNA_ID=CAMNT_0001972639 /DNA_START=210 /DNA_END=521 /DNA_ORIENTATION=+